MNPHTPPSYRNGQMSPPASTTPSLQHHASSSEPLRGTSPISPPPSTNPGQQSYPSNVRSLHGFSPLPRSATASQAQPQMWPARYYDGAQMMTSPTPMPSSPELVPNQRIPQSDDPKWLEWLRETRLKQIEEEKQKQPTSARTHTPEQHHPQQQYYSDQQPYPLPRPDLRQQHHAYPQHEHHPPQQSYTQQQQHPQQRRYTEQLQYTHQHHPQPLYAQPQPDPQHQHPLHRRYTEQQHDPYYQEERYQPVAQYPFSRTPSLPLTRQMQRNDTGHTSRTTSIDDYTQRVPLNHQGLPMNYASEQSLIFAPRTGHRFGKVTVRDNAKVLMGNGVDPNSTEEPGFHDYGDVDAANLSNVLQGDMPVADVHKFFER